MGKQYWAFLNMQVQAGGVLALIRAEQEVSEAWHLTKEGGFARIENARGQLVCAGLSSLQAQAIIEAHNATLQAKYPKKATVTELQPEPAATIDE